MHVISNERALAHWQALCHLPEAATGILRTRFINEQLHLTSQILSLTDAATQDADGKVSICPSDDWDGLGRSAVQGCCSNRTTHGCSVNTRGLISKSR